MLRERAVPPDPYRAQFRLPAYQVLHPTSEASFS
jgi:hypothetical protein